MLKIIYAGTPEFAVPALESLLRSEHRLVAVYTQPDRPAGRGRKLHQSPVKKIALEHDLPLFQPASFNDTTALGELRACDADLMVVAAYGLLLPAAVLEMPRLGCVNIHASLLPRWRGASPIQQAILAGDQRSFGFIEETEAQVEAHLDDHLQRLPEADHRSREILRQMSADEARHGAEAGSQGAEPVPEFGRRLMRLGGSFLRQVAQVL